MDKNTHTSLLIILAVNLAKCKEVDVCVDRDGELSYNVNRAREHKLKVEQTFTRNGCENNNGTLIIRLLDMKIKVGDKCANKHSLKLIIGNSKAEDICPLSNGDCFILQETYCPCVDLSQFAKCEILKWRNKEFIYPANVIFENNDTNSRRSFKMNYTYMPCEDVTSKTVTSTSSQSTHSSTAQPTPQPTAQPAVDIVLALVFGILFGIAMIALVGLAVRHLQLIKQMKKPMEQSPEPEPTYSAVNKTANRNRPSEREIVVNQVYEMS